MNKKTDSLGIKLIAIAEPADKSPGVYRVIKIKDNDGNVRKLYMRITDLIQVSKMKTFLVENGYPLNYDAYHWERVHECISGDTDNRIRIESKPGYYGNAYLCSDNKMIGVIKSVRSCLSPDTNLHMPVVEKQGTFDQWKNNVAVYALNSSRLMLGITAAFSSFLIRSVGIESGGFHFFGGSSIGKSTTLYAAESIRGSRDGLGTWDVSESGLGDFVVGHNDSFATFDELQHLDGDPVKAAQKAKKATHKISSGKGKYLSTKYRTSASHRAMTWRIAILSTGELSLAENAYAGGSKRLAGEEVRVIDVPADAEHGKGIYETLPTSIRSSNDLAKLVDENTMLYYGAAMPRFLKKFTADLNKDDLQIKNDIRTLMNEFLNEHNVDRSQGIQVRYAERFALSYAAGALAVKYNILPFHEKDVMKGISICYQASISSHPTHITVLVKQAKADVLDALHVIEFLDISKANHGFSENKLKSAEAFITSIKGARYKALSSRLFEKLVSDESVRKRLLDDFEREGYLFTHNSKRTRAPATRLSGSSLNLPRCYCFIMRSRF